MSRKPKGATAVGSTQLDTTPTARVGFSPTGSSKLSAHQNCQNIEKVAVLPHRPHTLKRHDLWSPLVSLLSFRVQGERHRSSSLPP